MTIEKDQLNHFKIIVQTMFKNYFKTAWRNLLKNKIFSILNIAGLTVGIVCAALIFLWVEYQFQYNRILPDSDKVFVLKNNQTFGDRNVTFHQTCGPLAPAMKQDIPGFKDACRTMDAGGDAIFSVGDKSLRMESIFADSNFFNIFKFPVLQKNGNNFLNNSYGMAISKKMAEAFFGNENAIGKSILFNKKQNFQVTAVYDVPSINMEMKPECVMPLSYRFLDSTFKSQWTQWGECGMVTYATLNDNVLPENINAQLKDFIAKKSNGNNNQSVFLYPYTRLGIYDSFQNGKEIPDEGAIKYIKMFSLIALIILLIACINFMNLSTARSEKRAKEIGLKKVLGVTRRQLIIQFITESILTGMIAVIFAALLLGITVPAFGNLIHMPLQLNLQMPSHFLSLIIIGIICGLVAGSYPAFFLSSFNPIRALKKQTAKTVGGANLLRKGLVVVQFTVSVVMIICTIVIFNQINHTKNRDLGFNKDDIMMVVASETLANGYDALKQNLLSTGAVQDVALSWNDMFNMYSNGNGFKWQGYTDKKDDALITMGGVSSNYLPLMGVKLKEGRYFYDNAKLDSSNIIINPALAKLMGKEGRIGGRLYMGDDTKNAMTIVGITNDFVYNNIYEKNAAPMYFSCIEAKSFASWGGIIFIKLKHSDDVHSQIESIRTTFKKADNLYPFDYRFLDDSFERLFRSTQFVGKLALLFGGLAIFISCLGLFGLSSFMAEQRTKEIGVRKVLGASVFSIAQLLNKDFLKLVAVSCLIAFPIAWWYMHSWLQNYEYRIQISWWIFVLSAFVSVIISLITVSFQSIKAATANPVKSIKTE